MPNINEFEEIAIKLPSGGTLCCARASGRGALFGGSVHIRDADGNEVIMWDTAEWREYPELVMGAIFGAASQPISALLESLHRTHVRDRCWV